MTSESQDIEQPKNTRNLKNKPTSSNYSVQASIILKSPIFLPVGRVGIRESHEITSVDNESLRMTDICKKYGYDQVVIRGERLGLEVDFKVWAGCLRALHEYGQDSNIVVISFSTFIELCGYDKSRLREGFRIQIDNALARIQGQKLSFRRQMVDSESKLKTYHTSLLKTAEVNEEYDMVKLESDARLWDIYKIDHEILVSMQNLELLNRSETAQALYLYLTALPSNPHPIAISRLRERLELSGTVTNQNKRIKSAFEKLSGERLVKGYFEGRGDKCRLYLTEIVRKFRDSKSLPKTIVPNGEFIEGEFEDVSE